jgi:hypothetical protein
MGHMDWDEKYQRGEAAWDKGAPSPVMEQYLARQTVRGRTLVSGCFSYFDDFSGSFPAHFLPRRFINCKLAWTHTAFWFQWEGR